MKILCPECGSRMLILRSKEITKQLRNFVGECTHSDCRAKAVFNLCYSHYIRAPESTYDDIVSKYVNDLPPKELERLLKNAQQREGQGELF